MAVCERCGVEFKLSNAKKSIGKKYGAGAYDEFIEPWVLCADCASDEIGTYDAYGEELMELMGDSWDED